MKRLMSVTALVLLLVFTSVTTTGCIQNIASSSEVQYGINATLLGINLKALEKDFEQMEASMELLQERTDMFSEEEWKKLQNISTLKDIVVKEIHEMVSLEAGQVTLDDVVYVYNLAKSAYSEGYDVVSGHWDEFGTADQILLTSFKNKAESAEERVGELLVNPDNQQLNDALLLIVSILGTAVKILGTAAAV